MEKNIFKEAACMLYAENESIEKSTFTYLDGLETFLKSIKKDEALFFVNGETVYIPDLHGDFVHLIITLYRHGLLDNNLNLKKTHTYVFLGDIYDRAPDTPCIDFWVNKQINNQVKIFRLLGNHEFGFFERDANNFPLILPAQDSIKDINSNFQITENLLKNIASGNILAAYVSDDIIYDFPILYVHSYIINDDFTELGLEENTNVYTFAHKLNNRLRVYGENAYSIFLDCKKKKLFDWKAIMKSFSHDPLFNIYMKKNDIHTSFLWRRTGLQSLKIYPSNFSEVKIPNIYQIIGHTPVFFFKLKNDELNRPFILKGENNNGKVQFSDVGIGYFYRYDFQRPDVILNKKFAIEISD